MFSRFVLFLVGLLLGAVLMWQRPLSGGQAASLAERRLSLLEEENARLRGVISRAEAEKTGAANKARQKDIERQVEELRGLKFNQPVNYQILDRSQLKATLAGKIDAVYSQGEFEAIAGAYGRLGLLPDNYPLRDKLIELLGEQVAAFFDQHSHQLVMFSDVSLENSQNRVILAHELVHALQDQHFGLNKMPLELKDNDDRMAAASALIEGDATQMMTDFMLKNVSLSTLKDSFAQAFTTNMEQLGAAPRFLRETLMFPYLRGKEFVDAIRAHGGQSAVNALYRDLPTSTAQILEPEKYLANPRDNPLPLDWQDTALGGKKADVSNVIGELGLRILFSEYAGEKTAADDAEGWRGDRFLAWENGRALVWRSAWRDGQDAAEAFAALRRTLEKRYAPSDAQSTPETFTFNHPRAVRLRRVGDRITLADAPDVAQAEALETEFLK